MSFLKISFAVEGIIFDEAYYDRALLHRGAAGNEGFLLMFSGRLWQDVYEVKCTEGTARALLARVIEGEVNELHVGGSIRSIEFRSDVSDFYRGISND